MPQYLLVHRIETYPDSQDEWIDMWRLLQKRATGEVAWLHSFYEPSSNKLYCQWQAPDLESIKACFTEDTLIKAPIVYSSEVVLFDLSWLDEIA
jgi:hypothetical protein